MSQDRRARRALCTRALSAGLAALFVSVCTWLPASAGTTDSFVEIYSARYKQLVTSSTLQWRTVMGREYPENLVPAGRVGDDVLLLCRAEYLGRKIPGYLKPPLCTIELAGHVMNSTNFQVLVNIANSAKLDWEQWTKTVWVDGAVSSDGFFVARTARTHDTQQQQHYIALVGDDVLMGKVEATQPQITVTVGQRSFRTSNADTLVEILPTHYFINDVIFDDKTTYAKSETKVLERKIFNNNDSEPLRISEKVHYEYTAKEWWGTVDGTYAGTPTVINWVDPGRGETRIRTKLAWGAQISRKKQDFRVVEFDLPPFSRLQITLDGSVQTRRRPYVAKLTTFYASNAQRSRKIRGHFLDEDLMSVDVRKEKFQLLRVEPGVSTDQSILDAERLQSSIEIDVRDAVTSASAPPANPDTNAIPKVQEHEDDSARVFWDLKNGGFEDDSRFWESVINSGCPRSGSGAAMAPVSLSALGVAATVLLVMLIKLGRC